MPEKSIFHALPLVHWFSVVSHYLALLIQCGITLLGTTWHITTLLGGDQATFSLCITFLFSCLFWKWSSVSKLLCLQQGSVCASNLKTATTHLIRLVLLLALIKFRMINIGPRIHHCYSKWVPYGVALILPEPGTQSLVLTEQQWAIQSKLKPRKIFY